MRGLMLQWSNEPWGAIDCRQPRYPRKKFRGPEVLRPRLTAGLPLSAFGPKAAVRSFESNRRRSVVLRGASSRSQRRPVRRAPSIDTRRTGTRGNLSHIADITRGPGAGPPMNPSPISKVQAKSRGRLSDLCHMRGLRNFRTRQFCGFMSLASTRLEHFGTAQRSGNLQCARRDEPHAGVTHEPIGLQTTDRQPQRGRCGRCTR